MKHSTNELSVDAREPLSKAWRLHVIAILIILNAAWYAVNAMPVEWLRAVIS